jgi:hypothetical protein
MHGNRSAIAASLLSATTITDGDFINWGLSVIGPAGMTLEGGSLTYTSAAPEPGAWILLLSGLAACVFGLKQIQHAGNKKAHASAWAFRY